MGTVAPTILLVEDNDDDVVLFQIALARSSFPVSLRVVRDGIQAMDYLTGRSPFANRAKFPFPAAVLLDLKLPGMDGFEVLRWIKQEPELSQVRVIVLTSSDAIRNANRAYRLGANSFLVKPMEIDTVREFVELLYCSPPRIQPPKMPERVNKLWNIPR